MSNEEREYRSEQKLYKEMYYSGEYTIGQLQARLRILDALYNKWVKVLENEMKQQGVYWV